MAPTKAQLQAKLNRIKALEEKAKLIQGLPHLYGFKFYSWARKVWDSTNRFNFLCGPNQCSKSSILIRKCIHWATETSLWPELWRTRPITFWYLYPSQEIINTEVRNKWIREFLPTGEYKNHPKFGWELKEERGDVSHILFNSGIICYFKSYTQKQAHLQAGSVHAMFCDEELPVDLWGELKSRLTATHGFYHTAFTATLGQDFWRQVLEDKNPKTNPLPDALKLQISLYDCQIYEDGSASFWTDKKIQEEIRLCPNEREVQKRIFGKFVKAEGLKYPSFDRLKNIVDPTPIPNDWPIYAGIDIGSGSSTGGHPSAITFLAVRPDYKYGRVFKSWVGTRQLTTASDVLRIFQELRGSLRCAAQVYDYSARDFYTIATRAGESFMPADKTVEVGENALNSLFKNGLLAIDNIPENTELIRELENLYHGEKKSKAVDDAVDALRYVSLVVPWDWSVIASQEANPATHEKKKSEGEKRRDWAMGKDLVEVDPMQVFEDEINEINSYYDVN